MFNKSGMIPVYKDGKEIKYLFMISSDANYGGSKPMVSKGGVEEGESDKDSAIREAEEELGLVASNLKSKLIQIYSKEVINWLDEKYTLTMFIASIKDPNNFVTPHYETKETVWYTLDEFRKHGRKDHIEIVEAAEKYIKSFSGMVKLS